MDRHLRKLDQELAKFKMELEADNAGITEVLERRESVTGLTVLRHGTWRLTSCCHLSGSLEMDSPSQPVNNHHVHSHTSTESKCTLCCWVGTRCHCVGVLSDCFLLEQRGSTALQPTTPPNMFQRRSSSLRRCCPRSHQTPPRKTRQVCHVHLWLTLAVRQTDILRCNVCTRACVF